MVANLVFTRGAWVGTLEAERRNGSAFVAEVRASLVTEPDGRSLRLMATFLDVTDRRRAEAENRRLAMVVEQASELVLVTDASGAIQYVNPAFVQATGYSRAELVSQNPRILKSGVHDRAVYQELWDTILRGEVWRGHLVNRARDGRRLEVEAVITPLVGDDGKVANFVEVARDVTREVQLEKQFLQAQKMEAVGRLAGGVAHDFNNILQIISGFGELLFADFDRQDPRREDLRRILEAARKAQNLTAKLLAYSRRQMIEPRVVALNEIVAAQQPLLRRLVGEDVWMETRLAPDLWPVEADAGQIEQVIMNLVVNARDAMPHGGELIVSTANEEISAESAATRPEARPGRFVRLEVSDTGIGMDSAALEHLFEPFFTTKAPGKGTGLGLAMAYGLVKQHRGWMEVRSQRGQGSAFALFLPAVAGARVRAADDRAGTPPPRSARGEHILLVEDEEGIRLLTERVLREHGYRVTAAASGREALVRYGEEKGRFDLLFADVVLPDINGLDLVESILARQPGLKILLASGYTDERSRWPEIRGRGIRFLHKPYPVADMLRAVQEALVGPEPRASL